MLTIEEILEKITSPKLIEIINSGEFSPVLDEEEIKKIISVYEHIQIDYDLDDEIGLVMNDYEDGKNSAYILFKDNSGLIVPFHYEHEHGHELDPKIQKEAENIVSILQNLLVKDMDTVQEFQEALTEALQEVQISEHEKQKLVKQVVGIKEKENKKKQENLSGIETGKIYNNFSFD